LPAIEDKIKKIKDGGFDGVELDVPLDGETCRRARRALDASGLAVVAQQWRTRGRTVAEHTAGFEEQYERALLLEPLYLNSHTGCDHFTRDENLAIFDHANSLAAKHGLPVYHETHRGRALFSAPATMEFLDARPELRLVADFFPLVCVHEIVAGRPGGARRARRRKNACAIHARIGHAEGPQVPDPRGPALGAESPGAPCVVEKNCRLSPREGCDRLPICPEFGPPPYMTLLRIPGSRLRTFGRSNCYLRGLAEGASGMNSLWPNPRLEALRFQREQDSSRRRNDFERNAGSVPRGIR